MNESCIACPTRGACKPINTVGTGQCDLLLVIGSPSYEDVSSGVPLTGYKYQYIWDLLSSMNVFYYVTSVVKCKSTKAGVDQYCAGEFREEVARLKPKCILFSGESALVPGLYTIVGNPVLAEYRQYAHTHIFNGHTCKVLATYQIETVTPDQDMIYTRVIDDIVYAARFANAYKSEGKYRSISINADQFHRIVDIWLSDPTIEYVSYDTESNGLDPFLRGSKITSFSVSVDGLTGFNIFLYATDIDISDGERSQIIEDARRLLTTKKVVVHHSKHEHRMAKVLWGFTPNITDDTMYMSYILYLAAPGISHGLKYLSGRFVNLPPWEETLQRFVSLFKSLSRRKIITDQTLEDYASQMSDIAILTSTDIAEFYDIIRDPNYFMKAEDVETNTDPYYWLVPSKVMESYAGMDAIAPLLLMREFKPRIESDPGLLEAYNRMMKAAEGFANIEIHGCKFIDPDTWSERYLDVMEEHLKALKNHPEVKKYEQDTGKEFSPTSPKCLQEILYQRLKFPVLERTSTGNPSAGEPAMIALIKKMQEDYGEDSDDPRLAFLWHLRDYKKMQKIQNTYFIGLQKLVHDRAYDGVNNRFINIPRDHSGVNRIMMTNYLLHGTDSGRASSNFHTIPHRSDVAKALTSIYYENGGILFQADHSQLELRVLACLVEKYYGDSSLSDAYRAGKDIHRFNASKVFNKPMEEILDAERRFSKTISFAICYGSSERSVAESTGRTPDEVHDLFNTFYSNFPGVKAYIEDSHRFASQYGCVRTPMGRVRWVPGSLNPDDRSSYGRAMRQAQNQIIQSSGSDLSLATVAWWSDYCRALALNSQIMNWVHDSLTWDSSPGEWVISYYSILYGMKYLNEKRDWVVAPLGVDVDISANWSDHCEIKESHINPDGSWTFEAKGYRDVFEDVIREAPVSYEILEDEILSSEEFTENVGNGLIAKKSANLSYDNKTFINEKRRITLMPKSSRELDWCRRKYDLEQGGSHDLPEDPSIQTGNLY